MNTPFERLDAEVRAEWLGLSTTMAFLGTVANLRTQVVEGLIESVKAGTINENTICVIGGELRSLDQLLTIVNRKATARG